MSGHFKKICEFGKSHGQCRCMGPHQTITVPCDRPEQHRPVKLVMPAPDAPVEEASDYLFDEPLRDRLDNVLERELWWMQYGLRQQLLDRLLEEIK